MKVIDLLNKIANGEEVPKKILYKYQNKDFYEEYRLKWNKKYEAYYTTKDNTPITHLLADNLWNLNDEIEIIEDTPKEEKELPEKIEDILHIDDLIPPFDQNTDEIWKQTIKNHNKINEICDYLEYLKNKGE